MKKSYFRNFSWGLITCIFIAFSFFVPSLLKGEIPIPADSVLGLYHPFRDTSVDGYNPGKFPVKNPLITDPVLQTYPWKSLVVKSIKSASFPFWNPYSFSGQPLLANVQSSTFSVLNVLFFILPFNFAWAFQIILSSILTAIFMFTFLKNLRSGEKEITTSAAILGSITLTFSGFFIAWLEWGTIITTAMWLPLALLCLLKLSAQKNGLWFLLLVFSLTQVAVAGHLQTALYVFFAFLLYAAYISLGQKRLKVAIIAICAFFFSMLIASPQLLPSLQFINDSARGSDQGYYPSRQDWFIPPQNLLQVVIPDLFGNPATYNYWGVWNYAEFVSFIGVIPFFFVILALLYKRKETAFFVILLALSLVLALPNFISLIPYQLQVPFLSSLQPSRILFLVDFSLAVLAAYGLSFYQIGKKDKKALLAALVSILAILAVVATVFVIGKNFPTNEVPNPQSIALKNSLLPAAIASVLLVLILAAWSSKIKKQYILTALILLAIVDLFRFAYKFTPFSKNSWIFPQTKITSYLNSQTPPFRIMSTDRRIMHPNISSYYTIESVEGYDPLYLKTYGQFIASWQGGRYQSTVPSFNRIVTPQKLDSPIMNLLNVRYVLSFDEIKLPGFEKVQEEGITKLYKNQNSLPRVFFVRQLVKADNEQAFGQLNAGNFKSKAYSPVLGTANVESFAQAVIKYYSPNKIQIQTKSQESKPLIITNVFDPGWQATIDREPTKVIPADVIFQAIIVPAGSHEIELFYRPPYFTVAVLTSIVGLIAAIFVSWLIWSKRFLS